jgi:hypothetical protein
MANIKISQLPNLSQLANTTQFPVANANVTYAVTSSNIQSYMSTYPGGTFTGAIFSATSNVIAAGNVQAGNVRTTGLISATGNITSGNVSTGLAVITTANITAIVSQLANITQSTITDLRTSNVFVTSGSITGITDLAVADGGTGSSVLATNNVLLGNGASPLQTVPPGVNGNVLASNGTTWSSTTIASSGAKLGLGITGEVWNDVTASRSQGVTYTNSRSYPIQIQGNFGCNGGGQGYITVDGVNISFWQAQFNGCGGYSVNMPVIIPPGSTYRLDNMSGATRGWYELY